MTLSLQSQAVIRPMLYPHYIEAMEKAAQKVGLGKETAKALILQNNAWAFL